MIIIYKYSASAIFANWKELMVCFGHKTVIWLYLVQIPQFVYHLSFSSCEEMWEKSFSLKIPFSRLYDV